MVIPHRSILSHAPLLGTAIRLGYLAAIGWLVVTGLHLAGLVGRLVWPGWWVWAAAGLVLADVLHYVLDKTVRN